jgi:hypothetical protein
MNITNQILLAAAMEEAMPLNFETLPLTEAAADATNFVCEFKGGANANETGVGGGLAGANLDFTCFGTVGAASSDWRAVSAASGFNVTSAWADAFIRNASGFSILWHVKDIGGDGSLAYLYSTSPSVFMIQLQAGTYVANVFQGLGKFGGQFTLCLAVRGDQYPAADELWILGSVDYTNGLMFHGLSVGSTQPIKLADFDTYFVSSNPQAPLASTITLTNGYTSLVGASSAPTNPAFSIKSVTAKLGASVTLA